MQLLVQQFRDIQPLLRKDEVWRNVDFSDFLTDELQYPQGERIPKMPQCNVTGLDALCAVVENGNCHQDPIVTPEGVIICSVADAITRYADLLQTYGDKAIRRDNPYQSINHDNFTDGIFIYVPDGVCLRRPIQIQSVVDAGHGLFLQLRNLVVLGRNSKMTLIHCDDSLSAAPSFSNNVTEICLGESASIEYYKLQNLNNAAGLLNHTYAVMSQESSFRSVAVTLNGGHIRNHTEVAMLGEHCEVEAHGLYLNDQEQQVDNYIFVDHAMPNCHSRELFKGILDDSARGAFNGHVLVRDGAVKTEAYQSNKNILLTDKAFINTKPFLEIYNDDVKCSHGSTIGQLDEQALFYIRSRGISERTAKTLLLYAFCDEVLQQIFHEQLRNCLVDLVKKRLHGEQTLCSECALHCSSPCNGSEVNFYIDPAKL